MRFTALLLCLLTACARPGIPKNPPATADVRPGIEMFLANVPPALRGKRVALLTNASAVDRARVPDIDLIARHPDLKLGALPAPEHGSRGTVMDGGTIDDETDAKTGVHVHSLYKAEGGMPTAEMLKDADAIVYDLLEVGGRTW